MLTHSSSYRKNKKKLLAESWKSPCLETFIYKNFPIIIFTPNSEEKCI